MRRRRLRILKIIIITTLILTLLMFIIKSFSCCGGFPPLTQTKIPSVGQQGFSHRKFGNICPFTREQQTLLWNQNQELSCLLLPLRLTHQSSAPPSTSSWARVSPAALRKIEAAKNKVTDWWRALKLYGRQPTCRPTSCLASYLYLNGVFVSV